MATVEEYKTAMNELAAATTAFQPYATFLAKLNEATSYSLDGFLEANFGLKNTPRNRYSSIEDKYRVDIARWPAREDISAACKRLAAAFNNAHNIYSNLDQADREYIKAPPHRPDYKFQR